MDVFQNKNRTSPDDETFEFLANAAAKNIEFVTGSVSMETLPKTRLPEAAIIGKSNVGKSSLVNMICNRKNLAFTSKKPGKTQQFNYFKINSGSEHEFYLVDVPGLGYAKVPKHLRDQWVQFLTQYISERKGLKVLFHLIDSRHGPVETDLEIMGMARDHLAPGAQYVVVLTKADKKDGKVPRAVRAAVAAALEAEYGSGAPVVITSAESRLGRDAMWHHLKRATLG
uniref:EngB-type G domain-containing protein n=1 Tax=Heterosigma akashiwo TaxID=2829 RepID=A0A6V1PQB5_HETAK